MSKMTLIRVCTFLAIALTVALATRAIWPSEGDELTELERQVHTELSQDATHQSRLDGLLADVSRIELPELPPPSEASKAKSGGKTDPSPQDGEWSKFPRTEDYPPNVFRLGVQAIDVNKLYRNRHLNPVDQYIDPRTRQSIADLIDEYRDAFGQLLEIEGDVTAREATVAIERGLGVDIEGQTIDDVDLPESVRAEVRDAVAAAGFTEDVQVTHSRFPTVDSKKFVTRYHGDRAVAVPVAAMPGTQSVREAKHFLAIELGGAILSMFGHLGLLASDPSLQMAERLVQGHNG